MGYYNNSETQFVSQLIEQFRKRRHRLGIPQIMLDQVIGCAPGLVAKWEIGNRKPSSFNLYCWAEALGCEIQLKETKDVDDDSLRY